MASECRGNRGLYDQVLSLLNEDEDGAIDILEDSLFEVGARVIEQEDELAAGDRLGSFQIQQTLGKGGMGTVYLAQDQRLDRPVALKVLPATIVENSFSVSRFRREARTASNIFHPNIAHVYEFGEVEGRYFIVMEYVPGQTLRQIIDNGGVDIDTAVDYAKQLAAALSAAHRSGTMHRDVKPENIIVSIDGLIKVLDFGLAKAVHSDLANYDSKVSIPGLIMGTTSYMSPEQLRGTAIDESTDVWSLGIVLYEMVSGRRPFQGETQQDIKAAVLTEEPPALAESKELIVSKHLSDIVAKCLRKDPAERYADGTELLDALRELEKTGVDASVSSGLALKRYAAAAAVIIVVLAGGFGSWYWMTQGGTNTTPTNVATVTSLAIMPFINESGNSTRDFLADGMTEFLINRISELPGLTVKARSSVFKYKGKQIDVSEVGKDLSVQSVLLGSFAENDGMIRLNLNLIDVGTRQPYWTQQYERNSDEIIDLQQEIARDLAKHLSPNFPANAEKRVSKTFTTNHKAYNAYLSGRFHWNKRTGSDIEKSIEYYETALKFDPNYALAYCGLADSYVLLPGYAGKPPSESFPKAKTAALKALEIDPDLAEAHTTLSYVLFSYEWNFPDSEKELLLAIQLNPNYATAYHWYGNANLLALRRFDESIEALQHARRLDPLSLIINADLATSYLYAGRTDEAIAHFHQTLESDGNFQYARIYLGRAYLLKGEYEKALEQLKKAESLQIAARSKPDARIPMLRSRIYAQSGNRAEALRQLTALIDLRKIRYVSNFDLALAYTGLGDFENAFQAIEKGIENHDGNLVYLAADPLTEPLRSDPRFNVLVSKIGLAPIQ